jgi:hypothetical protein
MSAMGKVILPRLKEMVAWGVLAKQFQLTQNLLFVNTSASIRADRLGALEAPDVNLVWS